MIIYKATNKINGKIYIGQTTKSLKERISGHFNASKTNNDRFKNALRKYGKDGFEWEIIEECKTIKQLNEREEYWIKELNSINRKIGYNMKYGGDNHILTEEVKKKISVSKIGKELCIDEITKLYINDKKSTTEISLMFNVGQETIRLFLIKNKIQRRNAGKEEKNFSNDAVTKLYNDDKMSIKKISTLLNTSTLKIHKILLKNGVKTRTISEALKLRNEQLT